METNKFFVSYNGASYDWRTNEWTVTCKNCQKTHNPPTTIMRFQTVECPKCGEKETLDYNELIDKKK